MYVLKDKHCLQSAKSGVVFLECELVYNPVRACIRTINPRESKLLEEEQKFKRKVISSFPGLGGEEKGVHLEQPTKLKCFHPWNLPPTPDPAACEVCSVQLHRNMLFTKST